MSDNTNKNRAERRRQERLAKTQQLQEQNADMMKTYQLGTSPGEQVLHRHLHRVLIQMLYLKKYVGMDPKERLEIEWYGLGYWMRKTYPQIIGVMKTPELVALTRPLVERFSALWAETFDMTRVQPLLDQIIQEIQMGLTEGQKAMMQQEMESTSSGCPSSCFTSGREPHVRHYHAFECPLSVQNDLDQLTQPLPGLCEITFQGPETMLQVWIVTGEHTCVLWIAQGTQEYHVPMHAQLALHKDCPYSLVRMDDDQPCYSIGGK